ncbi:hypothetical protein Hbut_0715 [Hyperthermus butylicus DSM 5456]|uniref:Uncharacterized protein n=1 Tax=Hyperthermus butylicus (strain DSM 5456 / JCM 9403 / PLM1-5) TaxID=415426 RepID=A2BKQ9_HYPBU|nr:hypothetical protein Hbut_0715 [Hyperthermus butylicus DSM 5456]
MSLLVKGFSLLFEPLSFGNYKWQGAFGPSLRGPQAYSRSSPLPLPSTMAGAVAAAAITALGGNLCRDECRGSSYPYCSVAGTLEEKLCRGARLRGPFYYVEGGGSRVACMYHTENSLICIDDSGKAGIVGVAQLQSVGIALDSLSRSALEGYIYTLLSVDLTATAKRVAERFELPHVKRYGVLVEVHGECGTAERVDGAIVVLGGEQRPHRLHVLNSQPLTELLKAVLERAGGDCYYWHIATPILLCRDTMPEECREALGSPRELLEKCLVEKVMGLKPCPRGRLVPEGGRVRFSAIGLGYSHCSWHQGRWAGGKRKYCAAIMPGWGIIAERVADWESWYVSGVGSYSQLGWGTIAPLPLDFLESLRCTDE